MEPHACWRIREAHGAAGPGDVHHRGVHHVEAPRSRRLVAELLLHLPGGQKREMDTRERLSSEHKVLSYNTNGQGGSQKHKNARMLNLNSEFMESHGNPKAQRAKPWEAFGG